MGGKPSQNSPVVTCAVCSFAMTSPQKMKKVHILLKLPAVTHPSTRPQMRRSVPDRLHPSQKGQVKPDTSGSTEGVSRKLNAKHAYIGECPALERDRKPNPCNDNSAAHKQILE